MKRVSQFTISVMAAVLLLAPSVCLAQSGLVGVVRDVSGAVLPGVTVEAESPALIEKVRSAVTDGQGAYRIVDLRPGTYTVIFSLTGFASFRRQGLELPASFTATVNAEMAPASIQETITVTAASPTVDVANVATQTLHNKQVLDALPVTRAPHAFTQLTVGVTSVRLGGVGGGREELSTALHGSKATDAIYLMDGQSVAMYPWGSGGGGVALRISQSYVSEISVQSSGGTAEQAVSGTYTNVIPKEGGNRFSGSLYTNFVNDKFQRSNLSSAIQAEGLTTVSTVQKLWDFNPAFGGPIRENKLWFFASFRQSSNTQTRPGIFENLTPRGWSYTPDLTRPAVIKIDDNSRSLRLTWQATSKNKIGIWVDIQPRNLHQRNYQFNVSPEATTETPYIPNNYFHAKWTSPVSNRVLLEAGVALNMFDFNRQRQPGVDYATVPAVELSNGMSFRSASSLVAGSSGYGTQPNHLMFFTGSASYVTGSHAFKVGYSFAPGWNRQYDDIANGDMGVALNNGVPARLTLYAAKAEIPTTSLLVGLYAQDAWKVRRMTVSGGVRYDGYSVDLGATSRPANQFVGAVDFPAESNYFNWRDVSPRLAVAIDLFGTSKTAVKAMIGRYMSTPARPNDFSAINRTVSSVTRTWTDANRDFSPDCDLANPLLNGECGQISNLAFGESNPNATTYAEDYLSGSGKRSRNWESSLSFEQELAPGISVSAGYYRRWWQGFTVNDNTKVTPADFDPYCITSPVDPRLPGGGGQQICGLYDVRQALFGQRQINTVRSEVFGEQTQVYSGFDLKGNVRLGNGVQVAGGMNIGREETDRCFVIDSPEELRFCHPKTPFQPNFRFYGVYPLPWGLLVSAVFQALPGREVTANYTARNAEIAPSLGRNLSSGAAGLVTVPLIEPGTEFSDPSQQLDLRLAKRFQVGRARFLPSVDIINVLNAAAVQDRNFTYGSQWLRPLLIQPSNTFKLGLQVDW